MTENDDFTGRNDGETAFAIYAASKVLADKASRDFAKTEKPNFTLITLHSSFVYGYNTLQTTADGINGGTNGLLWGGIMSGVVINPSGWVNVEDVAQAHVLALDPKVKKDAAYLIAGPNASWDDVLKIVEEDYPNLPYKLRADESRTAWFADTSRAERDLGIKWKSLRETVHEVVDQQLSFMAN